jgi:hypothetical protein
MYTDYAKEYNDALIQFASSAMSAIIHRNSGGGDLDIFYNWDNENGEGSRDKIAKLSFEMASAMMGELAKRSIKENYI